MQLKLCVSYDEVVLEGGEFVCKFVIIFEKEEGGDDEEEYEGKGRFKKDVKYNVVFVVLKRSYILQLFMDGIMLFI